MKLYDEKNHLTREGKAFEARISREPIMRLCFRYLKRGASIADMERVINGHVSYQLALANVRQQMREGKKKRRVKP